MALGVQVSDVFNTLQVYLGSFYVNNFNEFGRTWQVNVQADQQFRNRVRDIRQLQVRNNQGQMIQLGTLMDVRDISGPVMVMRYNLYSASAVFGNTAAGVSSGRAIEPVQEISDGLLPQSMASDWTELTYLQLQAGNVAIYVFALGVVFVFLVLAAQYESWSLPLAVILVVPMCLICSCLAVALILRNIWVWIHQTRLAERSGERLTPHLERLRFKRMLDWIVYEVVALFHDGSIPCVVWPP